MFQADRTVCAKPRGGNLFICLEKSKKAKEANVSWEEVVADGSEKLPGVEHVRRCRPKSGLGILL